MKLRLSPYCLTPCTPQRGLPTLECFSKLNDCFWNEFRKVRSLYSWPTVDWICISPIPGKHLGIVEEHDVLMALSLRWTSVRHHHRRTWWESDDLDSCLLCLPCSLSKHPSCVFLLYINENRESFQGTPSVFLTRGSSNNHFVCKGSNRKNKSRKVTCSIFILPIWYIFYISKNRNIFDYNIN